MDASNGKLTARLSQPDATGSFNQFGIPGTYTIGDFTHCELATPVINATIPGPGNSITLTLGKAKIVR